MKTITIYELLGMAKDEPDRSIYVKYFDRVNKKEDVMWACKENIIYKLDQLVIELNDEVEILEEEKKIPEETTVSEEQMLFNNLTTIDQEYVIRFMRMLQPPIMDYLKSKGDE